MSHGAFVASVAALVLFAASVGAQNESDAFDFALSRALLQSLRTGHTILPTFTMHVDGHSKLKGLDQDCEMHFGGSLATAGLVDPDAVVAEPPNLCANDPPGGGTWVSLANAQLLKKDCQAIGFPRIFTEHASSSGGDRTPIMSSRFILRPNSGAEGATPLNFTGFMGAPAGLTHIKASSADSCIANRTLSIRFKNGRYEFIDKGGQCGNFAIIEVAHIHPPWIRATGGGHSAIARVSADGATTHTLKLYTLDGTAADTWIASVLNGKGDDTERHVVQGIFTYDYFSILKAVTRPDGTFLPTTALKSWKRVDFPLAFIVYGETETMPWEEGDGD